MARLPFQSCSCIDETHQPLHIRIYSAVACHNAENFPSPAIPPDNPITPKLNPGKPPSNAQCRAIGNQAAGTTASDHHLASAFWSSSSVLTPPFSLPTLLARLCFSSCASLFRAGTMMFGAGSRLPKTTTTSTWRTTPFVNLCPQLALGVLRSFAVFAV